MVAAVEPAPNYLITTAMQYVVREGTGQAVYHVMPAEQTAAGKTGTTDDLRDSWFAGFTGDRLGVVWIGRDDNQPTGLTGSSGALRIWRDLFATAGGTNLQPPGDDIEYQWIDPLTGLRADESCLDAVQLPFIRGSAPTEQAPCANRPRPIDWFEELFN